MSESRARKRSEPRGGRIQREKKERRIQKEREESKEGKVLPSVDQTTYTDVQLDTALVDADNQQKTETKDICEPEHTATITREEECYMVIMGRCYSLD